MSEHENARRRRPNHHVRQLPTEADDDDKGMARSADIA